MNSSPASRFELGALLTWAVLLVLSAGVIHLAGARARFDETALLGFGTAAVGLGQVGFAVAASIVRTRPILKIGAVASGAAALLWTVSHLVGLPVGAGWWRPEPLSIPDLVLPGLEVAAAFLLLAAIARARRPMPPRAWRTALALLPAVLLTAPATFLGVLGAPDDTWLPVGAPIAAPAARTTTVTYCRPNTEPLAMDVTEPGAGAARPAPVVLYVHGGGPIGDRQVSGPGANVAGQPGADFVRLRDELSRRGFVVGTIDYRQSPLYPWPAQIEDAKCAVRFLRANAAALGIDPGRIGAWGSSGGGHVVSMLGTAGRSAGFDVGQYLERSSRLQAVVDMFGAADLARMQADSTPFGRYFVLPLAFGVNRSRADLAAASPLTYVAAGDPPFLILHGADDVMVRPYQSQELARRLQAAGVPVTLVLVEHTGHSMVTPGQRPSPDEVVDMVVAFFTRTLHSGGSSGDLARGPGRP
jgi:acetyl esterase/lipase